MRTPFFILLTLFVSSLRAADSKPAAVWVEITVLEAGAGRATEYYGSIEARTFEPLTTVTIPEGFVRLDHAAWLHGSTILPATSVNENGFNAGYGGSMYFRASLITRIVLLRDDFVKNELLPAIEGKARLDDLHKEAEKMSGNAAATLAPMRLDTLKTPEVGTMMK